jgi:hypothetical protein
MHEKSNSRPTHTLKILHLFVDFMFRCQTIAKPLNFVKFTTDTVTLHVYVTWIQKKRRKLKSVYNFRFLASLVQVTIAWIGIPIGPIEIK